MSRTEVDPDQAFVPATQAEWQQLAERSLGADRTLADIASSTLDGLIVEALYHDKPAVQRQYQACPWTTWDNRLKVYGLTVAERRSHTLRSLEGGVTSVEVNVGNQPNSNTSTFAELAEVLADMHLDMAAVSIRCNDDTSAAVSALMDCWHAKGTDPQRVQGALNIDPIGALARTGILRQSMDRSLALLGQLARDTADSHPRVTSVLVDSSVYHNAGATPGQELLAAIATGASYLETMLDAGMDIDAACNTLVFQTACDADYLQNVVKLRSLQRLWRHLATHLGAKSPNVSVVAETSQRYLSRRELWVNHLRNVSAASAAVVGGAQCIIVHPHNCVDGHWQDDDPLLGERMARNLPLLLQHESALSGVHDPMAGAFAAETQTAELCSKVWKDLRELQDQGGLIDALRSGSWQQALLDSQTIRVARLQDGSDINIGVNRFNDGDIADQSAMAADPQQPSPGTRNAEDEPGERIDKLQMHRDALAFEGEPA